MSLPAIQRHRPRAVAWILYASLIFFAFLCIANLSDHPAPFQNIDEHGHLSYAQHLIQQHRWWPDFAHFPMYDIHSGHALEELNYLNHPPTFYWLTKLFAAVFSTFKEVDFRYLAQVFYGLAMLLYWFIGQQMLRSIAAAILYAMFPFMLYLYLQIGFYNNDSLCFLGGMLAVFASLRWMRAHRPAQAFLLMMLAVLLASVKLTALLLVGSFVLACVCLRPRHVCALHAANWVCAALVAAASIAPYLLLMHDFGSPAPNTPGQLFTLQQWRDSHTAPAEPFGVWLAAFLSGFANQLSVSELTFIPILLYVFSALGLLYGLFRARLTLATPVVAVGLAGIIATCVTLVIHAWFSWQRYVAYHWIFDSLLRYYLPLISIYALTCVAALTRMIETKGYPYAYER